MISIRSLNSLTVSFGTMFLNPMIELPLPNSSTSWLKGFAQYTILQFSLLPWDFGAVGATTSSHKEDIFNQFSNPFLDKIENT